MSRRKAAVERRHGESSQGQGRAGALSLREQSGTVCSLTVDGRCRAAHRRRTGEGTGEHPPVDEYCAHINGAERHPDCVRN